MLARLGHEHSRALIDNLVGAPGLPDSVLSQIERRTEGNPFFIEEVVRALIADGTMVRGSRNWRVAAVGPVADLTIPDTVQGVIVPASTGWRKRQERAQVRLRHRAQLLPAHPEGGQRSR